MHPLDSLTAATREQASSTIGFADGGRFRIEIPSVENASAFERVVAEAAARSVPVHRVSQGSGISLLLDQEIRDFAQLGAEHGIEVCLFVGPRAPWTGEAASALVPDGKTFGWRHLSANALRAGYDDVVRAAELGIRSFLLSDEGLIDLVARQRAAGTLPADVIIKVSALLGVANPVGARVLEGLGADTINVAGDTSVSELAGFRHTLRVPVDIYAEGPDNLGGFLRYHDLGEIVRVASPVHLKFGLRNAPNIYPTGSHLHAASVETSVERVRRAAIGLEHLARCSDPAPSPTGVRRPGVPVLSARRVTNEDQ